jgi:hypothetical protein
MCGSKHERGLWERERIEREPEAELLRWISTTAPDFSADSSTSTKPPREFATPQVAGARRTFGTP